MTYDMKNQTHGIGETNLFCEWTTISALIKRTRKCNRGGISRLMPLNYRDAHQTSSAHSRSCLAIIQQEQQVKHF